jgi:4-amino-4-deoxy-L-arabinose transferase-like glycosyltransferase
MPLPTTRRLIRSTALAITLAAIVLLTLLGHARLTDWDEGIYAGISRAMLLSGWLVPHWNGQPWLEKPPLELWLTALSFRLFGLSEFTARFTSALSGIALIGLLHAWLTLRRNEFTAWLNTLILLTTFGFLHVARIGEMDVLLSLGCTVALIGLCELSVGNATGWLLFWLGFAAALMTKGAASITLPITLILWAAVTLAARPKRTATATSSSRPQPPAQNLSSRPEQDGLIVLRSGETRSRSATTCLLGLALFLTLTLPWHLAMLHRFGSDFTANYLGLHVLTRATSQIEGHTSRWYFYLRVLLLSAAPWVLVYPVALYSALANAGCPVHDSLIVMSGAPQKPAPPTLQPFAFFALTTLLLFSAAQTRLPHYIAPAYPALSVLTAAWLANHLGPRLIAASNPRPILLKYAAAALALCAAAALLTAAPRKSLHTARLANGQTTPDNREQVGLLKQVFEHPTPAVAAIPGPLLTLRAGMYNPIPTTVFYSGRQVQQTALEPATGPRDKYTNDPIPLKLALDDHLPHLLLADRSLIPRLPSTVLFQPLATTSTLTLGVLTPLQTIPLPAIPISKVVAIPPVI